MNQEMISVIVPVYNVENYLEKCVESLLNQTYTNYEIILIDDGSTDNSSLLCDKYLNNKKVVVVHKSNGGLSDARNYGLKIAKGKYISFVDSDDFVDNDYLESLYLGLIRSKKNISACGAMKYYSGGRVKEYTNPKVEMTLGKVDAHKYAYIIGYYDVAMWNKLFDKKLFKNIRFPLNKKSEDVFILYKLIEKSNGLYYNSNSKYYYRQRKNSITKSSAINYDIIKATQRAIKHYKNLNYKEALLYSTRYLLFSYIGVYNANLRKNDDSVEERKKIRENALRIKKQINYKYLGIKRKIQLLLFIYCKPIYDCLYKLFYKIQNRTMEA